METELLYDVGQGWIYVISLVGLVGAMELGRWFGRRHRRAVAPSLGTIESAVLILLALMIGFTFSMALNRYDSRKAAVLDEANAIGTALLRSQLLPAPQALASADLLASYARARLAFGASGRNRAAQADAIRRSLDLQNRLWHEAAVVAATVPPPASIGLYIQALNNVIEMHEKRLIAIVNHVPETVVLLLYLIAAISTGLLGYSAGVVGDGERGSKLVMAVLIATVLNLVIDLDRPYRGLVTISQQPLQDLIQGLPPAS